MAIAALLLLSFGVFNHYRTGADQVAQVQPSDLEKSLIITHDGCCKETNHHHLKVSKTDDAAITDAMHTQLNRPVVMFRPTDSSWVFRGASMCRVGGINSGHLVFARTGGFLSIFNLPITSLPKNFTATEFSDVVDQHSIVGFVKNGALFCMVSSGPTDKLTVDQLKQMKAEMHPSVAGGSVGSNAPVLLTELLRPLGQ